MRYLSRRVVFNALDSLGAYGDGWTGNVQEVYAECYKQGHSFVSEYVIRKILKERGESLGQGQYKIKLEVECWR